MNKKIKVLKDKAIIRNVDFTAEYYERLTSLFIELSELFSSDEDRYKPHLETVAILLQTLDELAENQGLVEEVSPSDIGLENSDFD